MSFKRIPRRVNPAIKYFYFDIQSYGLCNQLFSMACAIADGSNAQMPIAFRGIYPDMTSSRFIPVETFIDIEQTNNNIAFLGTRILTMVKSNSRLLRCNMFATTDWQKRLQHHCLQSLVFSAAIRNKAMDCAPKEPFYCIHFRLDVDMLIFYRAGPTTYHLWIGLTDLRREDDARSIVKNEIEKHKDWIRERVKAYADAVLEKCVDVEKPIYVLTGIGKPTIHLGQNDLMEWAFQEFSLLVQPRKLIRCAQSDNTVGREYAAAVELNIACMPNMIGFIGSSGSTFSETIRIRNAPEKLLMVVS